MPPEVIFVDFSSKKKMTIEEYEFASYQSKIKEYPEQISVSFQDIMFHIIAYYALRNWKLLFDINNFLIDLFLYKNVTGSISSEDYDIVCFKYDLTDNIKEIIKNDLIAWQLFEIE